MPDFAE
jgi:hypothetical protein